MRTFIFKSANLADYINKPNYINHIICLVDTGYFYTYHERPMLTTYTSYHKEKLKLEEKDAYLLIDLFNQALFFGNIPEYSVDEDGIIDFPGFGRIKFGKSRNSNEGYRWKKVEGSY